MCQLETLPNMHVWHADTIISTFTGNDAPLAIITGSSAVFRRCSFRDLELKEEVFDVSKGSSVRLENCTFTNITVPDNEYVSTSYNDWTYFWGYEVEVTYYPEDDAWALFDVTRLRANDSRGASPGTNPSPHMWQHATISYSS